MKTAAAPAAASHFWTLRIVVALVTVGFVGNAVHAFMVWLQTSGS